MLDLSPAIAGSPELGDPKKIIPLAASSQEA